MKPSILIGSYLWKDTWKRWSEQPGSPLARVFVTGLLVMVATVILVAFQMLERSMRDRLERFGLDTLVVRESVTPGSAAYFPRGEGPDPLAILASDGRKLRLRQLFVRGRTEWQPNDLLVFSYPPEALPMLAGLLSPQTSVICLSDDLPEHARVRVQINHRTLLANVARPQSWLRGVVTETVLLVPQGWLPDDEQLGWLETTVFQRRPGAPQMGKIIAAVNRLAVLDQRPPPQIQSALPLLRELDELKQRRLEWEGILAAMLGAAVAMVYGAVGVLEFRQNLFVSALLRSFGAPRVWLYGRHWLENIFLVNLAAIAAVGIAALLHNVIFHGLGIPAATLNTGGNPYLSGAVISVFLWINVGVLLSSIPIAIGLRQPVGEILS